MPKFNLQPNLTDTQINALNAVAKKQQLIIVFENTKGLKIKDLEKLDNSIIISVVGGLTPLKSKYNNDDYQERTYYSPKELIQIIKKLELLERKINPLWSQEEKMMFVYQKLCEYLTYDEATLNGRDSSRNLLGLINGKSVCAGCAMIFKEVMDRLGIKCHYQNMQHNHAWNIVEINSKSYAVELTWDVSEKENNKCKFKYFCTETREEFYSHEYHNLQNEPEERVYDVQPMRKFELEKMHKKINEDKIKYLPIIKVDGRDVCILDNIKIIFKNGIPLSFSNILMTFVRDDGSSFLIVPTRQEENGIYEYIYIEKMSEENKMRCAKIYSETKLVTVDYELREQIANNLLSKERVKNKINNFNGYVGYIEKGIRYYNQQFEEEVLNIYR